LGRGARVAVTTARRPGRFDSAKMEALTCKR
jgi:hypothetical protein